MYAEIQVKFQGILRNKNGSTNFGIKVSRAIALYKQPVSHMSPLNKINKPV